MRSKLTIQPDRVLSTDDTIEEFAKKSGQTYNQVWKSSIKWAEEVMKQQMYGFISNKMDFIVDRTLLTKKSRRSMMDKISYMAKGLGVSVEFQIYFLDTDFDIITRVNSERTISGRSLPIDTLEEMMNRVVLPQADEGFTDIFVVRRDSRGQFISHTQGSKSY